jgi:alpha-L-rhamnosidase
LYGHVAGIRTDPAYPGFERILIEPHPGPGLTFANATFNSVHGPITSNWRQEGGNLTLDVSIPANTTAMVRVPANDAAQIKEGQGAAARANGVKFVRQEGRDAIFQVGSGSYKFTAPVAQ